MANVASGIGDLSAARILETVRILKFNEGETEPYAIVEETRERELTEDEKRKYLAERTEVNATS